MTTAQAICGPRYTFEYVAVQKVWDTDRRKRVSRMTIHSCCLLGLPYLHIPVISKSFTLKNNKQKALKAHWIYLIIHKRVSFPLPKSDGQQKGMQRFSDITQVWPKDKRYIRRRLFSTNCCHVPYLYLSNVFWKCFSEEMQYQGSFEVGVNIYEEN